MKGKLIGFALALLSVATIGVVQLQTKAYVDTSRDCDKYAIIYCGTMSPQEARNKYDKGAKVFQAMGISKAEIGGDLRNGVVYQDGRVVVNGKVVATGARTAIRNMSGGNKISGTNAAIYPTSQMGSAQTAMVKFDSNGRFVFAIMKPCGNPVKAEATKPKPKPSAVCKELDVNKISRTNFRFVGYADVKNGAKIKSYTFTVYKGSKVVDREVVRTAKETARVSYTQQKAGDYTVKLVVDTTLGKKNGKQCTAKFTVKEEKKPFAVCKDLTVQNISRTQFRFTATAEIGNSATINGYNFTIHNDEGEAIASESVDTSSKTATYTYTQTTTGDYLAKVVVRTSVGDRNGEQCTVPFTVEPKEEQPIAKCVDLTIEPIKVNEQYRFVATAEVSGGATISSYDFVVYREASQIDSQTVTTSESTASLDYTVDTPGGYEVQTIVNTSLGERNGPQCKASFNVTPPEEENPGVTVTKHVENQKYVRVGVDVEYEYQIRVTNTGDQDLTNVEVTDTPENGITLLSASAGTLNDNVWTHTIPVLAVGESMDFTLKAKVPAYLAGLLTNTVCVDAPEVPGKPDACDSADVDVPKEAEEIPQPEAPAEIPKELPTTGPVEVAAQLIGMTSLAGAGTYYLASRRRL